MRRAVALWLALACGAGIGFGLHVATNRGLLPWKLPLGRPPAASPAPATSSSAAASASAPSARSETPPAPAPSASTSPAASSSAAAPPGGACMRRMFPDDTFAADPTLDFVCTDTDAVASASRLRTQLVVEGRGRPATGGMKEWAVLGFYELAALAVIRGACCPDAKPLAVPDSPETCSKLGESLAALEAAGRGRSTKDDLADAVKRFDADVRCIAKLRQTERFAHEPLLGGEATTFDKTAARLAAK